MWLRDSALKLYSLYSSCIVSACFEVQLAAILSQSESTTSRVWPMSDATMTEILKLHVNQWLGYWSHCQAISHQLFFIIFYIYIWPSRRSICTDYSAQLILVFNRHPPMVSVSSWFYAWYPQISVSCFWCANGYMVRIRRFTRVTVCSVLLVIILVMCLFCWLFYCDLMCGLKTWLFWLCSLALL